MRAVRIHKFGGGPRDLVYEENVLQPHPKEGEVLVKVRPILILSPCLKRPMEFITGIKMICYNLLRLSHAQERILKHFFECNIVAPESVSHISESITLLQPSVHRSVSSLIRNKYLVKDKKPIRSGKGKMSFEKALYVTDKGIAAAIVLGITVDQLENYLSKYVVTNESAANSISYINRFKRLYKVPIKREFLLRRTMEYLLNNSCFDNLGRIIYLAGREFRKAYRYIQDEFTEDFGNADTVKELLDKYGIDKCFLKEEFQKDRRRIDLILSQLEK